MPKPVLARAGAVDAASDSASRSLGARVTAAGGSFDLAVTRFSGRRAPERPGADAITREAYSHECSSAGFWPGGGSVLAPAYYAYTAPAPQGLRETAVRPDTAYFDPQLGVFLLRIILARR